MAVLMDSTQRQRHAIAEAQEQAIRERKTSKKVGNASKESFLAVVSTGQTPTISSVKRKINDADVAIPQSSLSALMASVSFSVFKICFYFNVCLLWDLPCIIFLLVYCTLVIIMNLNILIPGETKVFQV